ncbi:hypothetical protein IU403_04375 [Aerococcaceae bacterium zg-BR22]|uniref:CdaR family protein n=1 Tax=Aerococcaceae bacterium zg-1292 TaxID=2774330 RepID=UPI004063D150|nr:hypothetical protein [Aerococcaceae bacterium zg-BR22]
MKKSPFDNIWVMRAVSLFFAILLFVSVANENGSSRTRQQANNSASVESSVTISNVPVTLGKHEEGTFVSGMPETVSVRLTGPKNIINQISAENLNVTTESIVGVKSGVKAIRFVVNGLPKSVEYKVTPDLFYGTISTKETKAHPVEYEIANNAIAEGYEATNVKLSVQEVTLTGDQNEMAKVARVVAVISSQTPQTANFTKRYRLQVLDKEGKLLDVNVSQPEVEATVEVTQKVQTVPLRLVPMGQRSEFAYQYEFVGESVVTLKEANPSVVTLDVYVDVSDLTESGTVTGYIDQNSGVTNPTTVSVKVTMTPVEPANRHEETTTTTEETTDEVEETATEPSEETTEN